MAPTAPDAGVFTCLDDLVRLKHQGQGFSFLPRQPIHSLLAGRHASRLRGRGLNFEEIRAYLPGDDIRSIDWKVTARTREPHTRVYTEERERSAIFVVDQRRAMFFGSQVSMKSVTAAEAAALGAWRVLGVGDRPGAFVFNDEETVEIRPHRSQARVLEILAAIERQNRALGGEGPSAAGRLNEVLSRVTRVAPHDQLVVIVSDLDGADDETRHLVTRLAQHNDVLVAFVYDPLEAELPPGERLVVSDGTLQLEVDGSDASLRQRFAQAFEQRLDLARQFLQRREIPVLPLDTVRPVAEQVREQLGHAPQARRVAS